MLSSITIIGYSIINNIAEIFSSIAHIINSKMTINYKILQ